MAIPSELRAHRVLDLASVVLSSPEYTELCDELKPDVTDRHRA